MIVARRAAPPWVANELWRRAQAVPALDLDLGQGSFRDRVTGRTDLVTFTRASSALEWNGSTFVSRANDVPRFQVDPATGLVGYLAEEGRTNSIRNSTMQGAVAGTPGTLPTNWAATLVGLTQQVIGVGTQGGIDYIDIRLSGTTSGTSISIRFEGSTNIAVTQGQVWSPSFYYQLIAGTWPLGAGSPPSLGASEFNAGGSYVGESTGGTSVLTAFAPWSRTHRPFTIAAATAAWIRPYLAISCNNAQAVDFTIRLGWPQCELGSFATSPILTTNAAVARSADIATVTGANFSSWYNTAGGSWYAEAVSGLSTANSVYIFAAGNGAFDNSLTLARQLTSQAVVRARSSAVDVFTATGDGVAWPVNTARKIAFTATATSGQLATLGVLRGTEDTSIALPSTTELNIGSVRLNGSTDFNGIIARIAYWPAVRLPNATLQALSS